MCFQTFKLNFGNITLNIGFFQLLGTMSHEHSLETIIVIVTYIW